MIEIFKRHGFFTGGKVGTLQADERKSVRESPNSTYMLTTGNNYRPRRMKRRLKDLMSLSESPLPSRAIKLIRSGITGMDYGVQPKIVPDKADDETKYDASMDLVRDILEHPNSVDGSFKTFMGQIVEDILMFDAGCWEYVKKPLYTPPNVTLSLEVVPGHSVAPNIKWNGDPKMPRWAQTLDNSNVVADFLDSELEYIMMRKRSTSLFGISPLEVSIEIMDSWLNVFGFQKEIASNAYPAYMVWLGEDSDEEQAKHFRAYWEMELKGKGTPGFFGGFGKERPQIIETKPTTDEGLFLKFQEMLVRVLAYSFDLSPLDFNMERDVNRNTGETFASATVQQALKPIAEMIAGTINSKVIPKIAELTGDKLIQDLEFFWVNLNPKDNKAAADLHAIYLDRDVITIDEARADLDYDPLPNGLGKLTKTGFQTLMGLNPESLINEEGYQPPDMEETDTEDGVVPEDTNPEEVPAEDGNKEVVKGDFTKSFPFQFSLHR